MKVKRLLIFFAVIIFLIDLAYFYPKLTGKTAYEVEIANITRIIDGDTFETDIGTVRLLCINAPEKNKAFYNEARDFLREIGNREVGILRDKEDKDKYERKLRYIFYKNRFINEELIENGLAHIYLCNNLKYEKQLEKAQEKARQEERGIWKKSQGKCKNCIGLLELNAEEEFFILKNNCNFSCELEVKDEANHFFDIEIEAKEEKTIYSKGKVWNDDGDSLFLRDEEGLVLYYHY